MKIYPNIDEWERKKDTCAKILIEFTNEEVALIEELITSENFCLKNGVYGENDRLAIIVQSILVKIMPCIGSSLVEFSKEELALIHELITNETFCDTHDRSEWLTSIAESILDKIVPYSKDVAGTFLRRSED